MMIDVPKINAIYIGDDLSHARELFVNVNWIVRLLFSSDVAEPVRQRVLDLIEERENINVDEARKIAPSSPEGTEP